MIVIHYIPMYICICLFESSEGQPHPFLFMIFFFAHANIAHLASFYVNIFIFPSKYVFVCSNSVN